MGLLGLLLLTGCLPHRPHPFPVGIYAPGDIAHFALLRETGFNVVCGPATPGFLNAADAAGLRVLAAPGTRAGPGFDPVNARTVVAEFERYPALWAWSLADEPDLHGITPEQIRFAQRVVKSAGTRRPTALTVWNGGSLSHYSGADILMVDRYPVGLDPLAMFFKQVRIGRIVADVAGRRLVPVLQAMDWSVYPPETWRFNGGIGGSAPAARAPTLAELRCMVWGSRVLGADGLFFYCYDDGLWRMPEHPEVWSDLRTVVREIRDREPLFVARQPAVRLGLQWFEPERRLNEALESSVLATLLDVETGNAAVGSGRYLVLVNTTAEHHLVRLDPSGGPGVDAPVLGGGATVHLGDGRWMDPLPPYGVQVLGPLPAGFPKQPGVE